ncbi:(Fe-S)-binding protein [Deferribacteraceae bacterium V6Fe1]|nr:(Fe-S)-binding protein [Deferribacteraceae bacterium V6Fe1]
MDELIKELKELEELVLQCMKCGTCQAHCPLYQKDLLESTVARGKISLIESVYEGRLENATKILKHLDYCILCGRCKENCPSGVKTDEIFLKAKAVLRKIEKLPSWGKAILKIVMEKPELLAKIAPLMHIGMKFGAKRVKNDIFKPILGSFSKRNVKQIAKKPFSKTHGGFHKAQNEKMEVYFYPGCAANFIFPEWGEGIISVLNHFGVSVYVPEVNKCCGIPAATLGELETYKKMVNENLDDINKRDCEYVITCCPTCQYALSEMGPKVTEKSPNKHFYDILMFLDEVLNVKFDVNLDEKFSLHTPCHYLSPKKANLKKHLEENIQGDFVVLENQSCCGFGGTFNMKKYDDSKAVGMSKAEEVKSKNVKKIFTPCPGCAMQLTDAIVEVGSQATVEHPIVYYAKELKNNAF